MINKGKIEFIDPTDENISEFDKILYDSLNEVNRELTAIVKKHCFKFLADVLKTQHTFSEIELLNTYITSAAFRFSQSNILSLSEMRETEESKSLFIKNIAETFYNGLLGSHYKEEGGNNVGN